MDRMYLEYDLICKRHNSSVLAAIPVSDTWTLQHLFCVGSFDWIVDYLTNWKTTSKMAWDAGCMKKERKKGNEKEKSRRRHLICKVLCKIIFNLSFTSDFPEILSNILLYQYVLIPISNNRTKSLCHNFEKTKYNTWICVWHSGLDSR